MNTLKLEKRTAEQLDRIRKVAETLPMNKRRTLYGICDNISVIAKKAGKQLNTAHNRGPVINAPYDIRTEEDIAAQEEAKAAVFKALMAGRRVDMTMGREFKVGEMHTVVCKIRKDIERKGLPVAMCDEWVRPEGKRPYKQYWIVKTES